MTRKNTNISEIRIEEVHDHEESKHFFRVYFYYENGKIEIMGESNILNKLPLSASSLYAKNMFNFVENLFDKKNKKININLEDEIVEKTLIK